MDIAKLLYCLMPLICGVIHVGRSQEGECKVNVLTNSSEVFVPFGQSVELNCSYTCPPVTWKTRLSKFNTTNGATWLSTEVLVDDWERSRAVCIHTLPDGNSKEAEVTIMAYALPSNVTIDLPEELEAGKVHQVNCTAHDVAPVKYLRIAVVTGGREIQFSTFKEDAREGRHTVKESFNIQVSHRDNLRNFHCAATLQLGTEQAITATSPDVAVRIYGQPDIPIITVAPSSTITVGGSFSLTCLSEGSPEPMYIWTVPPGARETCSQDNNYIRCSRAEFGHSGTYQCEARNIHGQTRIEQVIRIESGNGGIHASLSVTLLFVVTCAIATLTL